MSLPTQGLTGPALQFANAVNRYIDTLRSPPLRIVDTVSALPPASANQGRQIIVRDIDGAGTPGVATSLDGVWIDYAGATLA